MSPSPASLVTPLFNSLAISFGVRAPAARVLGSNKLLIARKKRSTFLRKSQASPNTIAHTSITRPPPKNRATSSLSGNSNSKTSGTRITITVSTTASNSPRVTVRLGFSPSLSLPIRIQFPNIAYERIHTALGNLWMSQMFLPHDAKRIPTECDPIPPPYSLPKRPSHSSQSSHQVRPELWHAAKSPGIPSR